MRQAIETKYLGPTNYRGARIVVRAQCGRMFVPWDHALGVEENHRAAAMKFALSRGWLDQWKNGRWVGGWKADDTGCVFVWAEDWA